ncbi:hypothetical protein BGX34_004599, partial [Mortierella sp. NVP85]
MVSRIFALMLLAAVVSNVHAYYFYAEVAFHESINGLRYKIHPVDIQVPGNDKALLQEGGIAFDYGGESMILGYKKYGYEDINMGLDRANGELTSFRALDIYFKEKAVFPCVKMDEHEEVGLYSEIVTRKVYTCASPAYYGRKGNPVPSPTTPAVTRTTAVVV